MPELISAFNFEVILEPAGAGGADALSRSAAFSDVSGLEITAELESFYEGGYNFGQRQLWKRVKPGTLVLKRGLTGDRAFWTWVQRCMAGPFPLPYVSGEILAHPPGGASSGSGARWTFTNGLAVKVAAPGLQAISSTVPIEELHIAHEGLSREEP